MAESDDNPAMAFSAYLNGDVPELLNLVENTDVEQLDLRHGEFGVRIHRNVNSEIVVDVSAGEDEVQQPATSWITSPLVGTFYRAAKPGAPALVSEGASLEVQTVVGIVEALNVLTEVEAGVVGVVVQALAGDGEPVEYGQRLFEVNADG